MNHSVLTLLPAQAAAQPAGGGMSMIIMMVALFAIIYLFMIRPQNKKQKELQQFRNNLTTGQDIVTIGGLHGKVKHIDSDNHTVTINVATGVDIKVELSAINNPTPEKK